MSPSLPVFTGALAVVALAAAAIQLATVVRQLRQRLEELETPPAPRGRTSGRAPRAMFSALYPETRSSGSFADSSLPGSLWAAAAAMFTVITVCLRLLVPPESPHPPPAPSPELGHLQSRLDSLATSLTALRDSVSQAAHATSTPPSTPGSEKLARRALTRSPGVLPPVPPPPKLTLDSAGAIHRTIP